MTQNDKQLLLITLCGMLPYGVKYQDRIDGGIHILSLGIIHHYDRFIPYLRSLSSMTEEEKEYIKNRWCYNDWDIDGPSSLWREKIDVEDAEGIIDYFNEHHFDYRSLIPMGLALEAPEEMYKTE